MWSYLLQDLPTKKQTNFLNCHDCPKFCFSNGKMLKPACNIFLQILLLSLHAALWSFVLHPWSITGRRRLTDVWALENWGSTCTMGQTEKNMQRCKCWTVNVTKKSSVRLNKTLCTSELKFGGSKMLEEPEVWKCLGFRGSGCCLPSYFI